MVVTMTVYNLPFSTQGKRNFSTTFTTNLRVPILGPTFSPSMHASPLDGGQFGLYGKMIGVYRIIISNI